MEDSQAEVLTVAAVAAAAAGHWATAACYLHEQHTRSGFYSMDENFVPHCSLARFKRINLYVILSA
jgi:2'-5' RNA ligase